jgi:hypothetical protein
MTQQTQAPYDQFGQPGYAPPPAPPKKPFFKKTWFIVLAALVLITIVYSVAGGGGNKANSTSADAAGGASAPEQAADEAAEAPAEFQIGQQAADGKFNFVVNGVDCSVTELGDQYFGTTAQGQFCIVDLTISNIGNEPQSFFGENATLFNEQGQKFSADTEAAIYLENSDSLYEEINPGNSLNSKVVFDVPAGMVPSAVELHDSMLSGGVTVALQ